jgi:type II secretory pathway component HofQ
MVVAALSGASDAGGQATAPPLRDLPVSRLEGLDAVPARPRMVPGRPSRGRADLDGRTLSLTFPRPAHVRDVLLLLVRGTPFSVVLEESVEGAFTGELRNLTIRQTLEAVLFSADLDYDLRGTVIRVFPRRPRTRLFEVNPTPARRWSAGSAAPLAPLTEGDPFADIDAGVRTLLSQQGRHHLDRRTGLVSVTDFTDRLDQIATYLETAQFRATRQVRIDARVLQVALNDEAWGVDLSALAARGFGGVRQTEAATAGFVLSDFDAFLRALGQWGRVGSAGAPRVLATNNEPVIVRVATGSRAAAETGAGSDLSLAVTPQISADGVVQLRVASRYSSAAAAADSASVGEADTVVRARSGETVVVFGLQHPVASAPGVQRTDVVLLLTPTIVGPTLPSQAGER